MKSIKVENMTSPKTGNPVANQFMIRMSNGTTFFQSYDSVIAKVTKSGNVTLDRNTWDYSVTTTKYRNEFLRENTAITRKKIESGEYKLSDLN